MLLLIILLAGNSIYRETVRFLGKDSIIISFKYAFLEPVKKERKKERKNGMKKDPIKRLKLLFTSPT